MAKRKPARDEAPTFNDDVNTAIHVVSLFRDLLSDETTRIDQARRDEPAEFDAARHAYLHRLRIAAENFIGVLSGSF